MALERPSLYQYAVSQDISHSWPFAFPWIVGSSGRFGRGRPAPTRPGIQDISPVGGCTVRNGELVCHTTPYVLLVLIRMKQRRKRKASRTRRLTARQLPQLREALARRTGGDIVIHGAQTYGMDTDQ